MTTKFNAEIKAEWVAALRSGKYKQGKGFLYNGENNSYCCLGVLQALHTEFITSKEGEVLDQEACGLSELGEQAQLAEMNDSGERNFAHIADFIEKTL